MRKTIQDQNNIAKIFESFVNANPKEAVQELHKMPLGQALDLLCTLPAKSVILCFENMPPTKAAPFLRRLPIKQACYILGHLKTLHAAGVFAALPVAYKARLKQVLDKNLYATLTTILAYSKDSVGAFIDQDYLSFKTDTKVREIILRLKNLPKEKFAPQVFIKDKNGKLAGIIRTQNLAFFDRENIAGSLMQSIEYKLAPKDNLENALNLFEKGVYQIPITDEKNTLLGVLNACDFIKKESSFSSKKEVQDARDNPGKVIKLTIGVLLVLFLIWKVFLCK
ncbi:MAG: magnesium transporter [Elusimicrobiaceae bacterium]|nr:magnesium transporter [Elusimicrobiaceae bacterium]